VRRLVIDQPEDRRPKRTSCIIGVCNHGDRDASKFISGAIGEVGEEFGQLEDIMTRFIGSFLFCREIIAIIDI
jgi:hypothetical protein